MSKRYKFIEQVPRHAAERIVVEGRHYRLCDTRVRYKGGPADGKVEVLDMELKPGLCVRTRRMIMRPKGEREGDIGKRAWGSSSGFFREVTVQYRVTRAVDEEDNVILRYMPPPKRLEAQMEDQ